MMEKEFAFLYSLLENLRFRQILDEHVILSSVICSPFCFRYCSFLLFTEKFQIKTPNSNGPHTKPTVLEVRWFSWEFDQRRFCFIVFFLYLSFIVPWRCDVATHITSKRDRNPAGFNLKMCGMADETTG